MTVIKNFWLLFWLGSTASIKYGEAFVANNLERLSVQLYSTNNDVELNFHNKIVSFAQHKPRNDFCPTRRRESAQYISQAVASLLVISSTPNVARAGGALGEEYRQGTAALGDSDENGPLPREAYKKLESGLIYADMRVGGGKEATNGSKCNLQWVLRKSNGYFVDSSQVNDSVPFIFSIGDGTAIKGVDEGIRGMREGGTRRLIIPVNMAYVDGVEDGKPGPLPVGFGPRQQIRRVMGVRKDVPGEYLYLEVQLTKVR